MTVVAERVGARIFVQSARKITALEKFIPGANWNKTRGLWSLPLNMITCHLLREKFGSALEIQPGLWDWALSRRAEARSMREVSEGEGASLSRLPEMFPRLAEAVTVSRPYQAVGARWIASGRNVLIADTVGLGKTVQTMAGVIESGVPGPYLVICPKTAVNVVWEPEILRWLPGHRVITLPEGKAKRDGILDEFVSDLATIRRANTWVVVHPASIRTKSWWVCRECEAETLMTHRPKALVCEHDPKRTTTRHDHTFPQLFDVEWGAIIADESDRSVLRISGAPTLTRRGMELLRDDCTREEGLRIAQSGTPFRSRPKLLWSTLNWLRPDEFKSFWQWAEALFEIQKGYNSSMIVGGIRPDREHLLYESLDEVMLRRTREEVSPWLPPKIYVGTPCMPDDPESPVAVWIPMEPEQERAYRQMEKEARAEIEGGDLEAIGILAEMTRLKQFATSSGRLEMIPKMVRYLDRKGEWARKKPTKEQAAKGLPGSFKRREELVRTFKPTLPSNKLNYIIQALEELGYPDDPQTKVIIASQFTSVLGLFGDELTRIFGEGMVTSVTGKVTGKNRKVAVDAFNQPIGSGPNIMLLNTTAGGSAITLDVADEMFMLDETWVPDDRTQLEGRNDNRRPEEKVVQRRYRLLASRDTIEVGIAMTNVERDRTGHMILDGRRGLAWAKEAMAKSR